MNEELMKIAIEMEKTAFEFGHLEKDSHYWYYILTNIRGCRGENCSCRKVKE